MNELPDTADALEAKETATKVPLGWWVLFFGLIVWGIYYFWTYTPSLGGWSQAGAYEEAAKAAASATATATAAETGENIFATILFTALATLAALLLVVGAARRNRKG
ncbi:MAG: hypothetical protein WCK73_10415 [Deltaproteobacteria bacterium]